MQYIIRLGEASSKKELSMAGKESSDVSDDEENLMNYDSN